MGTDQLPGSQEKTACQSLSIYTVVQRFQTIMRVVQTVDQLTMLVVGNGVYWGGGESRHKQLLRLVCCFAFTHLSCAC